MPIRIAATDRVIPNEETSATEGRVVFEPVRSAWLCLMVIGGLLALIVLPSWAGLAVFLGLSAITLCAGHSVGMHRLLIHRSFKTPLWLEHMLVYLGVLVGMAGPFGMIRAHDMRDWHQRQLICPPHPSHAAGFLKDAYWQLCCRFELRNPPELHLEPEVEADRFYRFLERTWMWQQLPLAAVLFVLGGWGWLLWGVCLRVSVSLIGHWAIGHFAHRNGHQGWMVEGLPVQGYNLPSFALITFGESLHGNHHAFPHSAKLGVENGQADLGFALIKFFEFCGLAQEIQEPQSAPARHGLKRVDPVALKNQVRSKSQLADVLRPLPSRSAASR